MAQEEVRKTFLRINTGAHGGIPANERGFPDSDVGVQMARELGASKVTRRFQVTIPEKVRKLLKLKEGDFVVLLMDKKTQKIFILPAKLIIKE